MLELTPGFFTPLITQNVAMKQSTLIFLLFILLIS